MLVSRHSLTDQTRILHGQAGRMPVPVLHHLKPPQQRKVSRKHQKTNPVKWWLPQIF